MRRLTVLTSAIALGVIASVGASAQEGSQARSASQAQSTTQEQARTEGTQLHASPAQVRQIQQKLNQEGYDAGSLTGTWNEQTQRAARNFQLAQGLEPTGHLDTSLLSALGMESILEGHIGGDRQAGAGANRVREEAPDQQSAAQRAQGSGTPIYVSPAVVRQIQQELNRRGHDAGAVDGTWGASTAEAARKFQQAQGLTPTGRLDLALLQALGLQNALTTREQRTAGEREQAADDRRDQRVAQQQSRGAGAPLHLSPEQVRQIQERLNQQGYDPGAADGIWGSSSRQATRDFQRANGLEPTGTLTLPTLSSLGLSVTRLTVALAEDASGDQQDAKPQQ